MAKAHARRFQVTFLEVSTPLHHTHTSNKLLLACNQTYRVTLMHITARPSFVKAGLPDAALLAITAKSVEQYLSAVSANT